MWRLTNLSLAFQTPRGFSMFRRPRCLYLMGTGLRASPCRAFQWQPGLNGRDSKPPFFLPAADRLIQCEPAPMSGSRREVGRNADGGPLRWSVYGLKRPDQVIARQGRDEGSSGRRLYVA